MPFVSRWSSRTVRVLTALLLTVRSAAAQTSPAQASTAKIVSAASAFLATLDEKQRSGMLFAFDDEKQRVRWSNFPTGFVPRSGVRFADMNPSQRAAAMSLLATALSKRGLEKVQQIVDADEVLRVSERNNPMFGKENDKAFALMGSLDEGQRSQAILGYRVSDLVLGPGKDGKTIQPEGLRASAMNDAQRSMLFDLITEWTGIVHESAAKERLAELKAGLNDTWFAWSGPTTAVSGRNGTAYYRIQGPKVVIEYAPQSMGGDPSMHIHSMYRDPTNDYGRKPAAK